MKNEKEKDPAFLFYPRDFISGTYTMRDDQIGKYIKLLCLQHEKGGKLTEKDMMKICKSYDEDIFEKFDLQDGYYINRRLERESSKRKSYTESRRQNRLGKTKTYDSHMANANGNAIKGVYFNEEKTEVFFEDGSKQKLGETQLFRVSINDLKPDGVYKGLIN